MFAWLHGVGAGYFHIASDGRELAASAFSGPDQPALRRAQAMASSNGTDVEVTRYLLGLKVGGQRDVIDSRFPDRMDELNVLAHATEEIVDAGDLKTALAWEARAASVYWSCWADVPLMFARADAGKLPDSWRRFGDRHSPISRSPRSAVTAGGAIVNFLYTLALIESRLALVALGLDPGLGFAHRDGPYREGAAFDLIEALRPLVDAFAFDLFATRIFGRREFVEGANGTVRLAPALARGLAGATLPMWEREVGPIAEEMARIVAASATSAVTVRTRLTQTDRKRGRKRAPASSPKIASACRICGLVLDDLDRAVCDECWPEYDRARTDKLSTVGKATLAAMRASADDPAHTVEASRKRAATSRERSSAMRAWEREHGKPDPELYQREVLPRIQMMTVPQLIQLTGLSQFHCWKVRNGERRLHARHWDAVLEAPVSRTIHR